MFGVNLFEYLTCRVLGKIRWLPFSNKSDVSDISVNTYTWDMSLLLEVHFKHYCFNFCLDVLDLTEVVCQM